MPLLMNWLNSPHPHRELAERRESGWLAAHLAEVDVLYGVPQNAEHHPEVDTGKHIELCLEVAAQLGADFETRFAVLTHDLGKGITPSEQWPKHVNHENAGVPLVAAVCDRFQLDEVTRTLATLVCKWHLHAHRAFEMGDASVVKFFMNTGLLDDEQLCGRFLLACESDARGRLGRAVTPYLKANFLREAREAIAQLPFPEGVDLAHPEGNRIHQARIAQVVRVRARFAAAAPGATLTC
jgi:tRNA nucleotidyltransferase (CCA-adding enzyme)